MEFFQNIVNFFQSPLFRLILQLTALFLVIIWAAMVAWTYRDAEARGASPIYWAVVVLIFNLFGWLVYLILRPAEYTADVRERELEIKAKEALISDASLVCPECHRAVDKDFLICPYCMKKLKNPCPSCSKPLKSSWPVCPYCRTSV